MIRIHFVFLCCRRIEWIFLQCWLNLCWFACDMVQLTNTRITATKKTQVQYVGSSFDHWLFLARWLNLVHIISIFLAQTHSARQEIYLHAWRVYAVRTVFVNASALRTTHRGIRFTLWSSHESPKPKKPMKQNTFKWWLYVWVRFFLLSTQQIMWNDLNFDYCCSHVEPLLARIYCSIVFLTGDWPDIFGANFFVHKQTNGTNDD